MRKKIFYLVLVLVLALVSCQDREENLPPIGSEKEACNMPVDFANAGDGVDFGSVPTVENLSQKTVMAWVNAQSFGHDAPVSDIVSLAGGEIGVDSVGWELGINDIGDIDAVFFAEKFNTPHTDASWRSATNSFTLNEWHHIAVTYDNSSTANDPIFYIDGVLSATTEVTPPDGTFSGNSGKSLIAGHSDFVGQSLSLPFRGEITAIRIPNLFLP